MWWLWLLIIVLIFIGFLFAATSSEKKRTEKRMKENVNLKKGDIVIKHVGGRFSEPYMEFTVEDVDGEFDGHFRLLLISKHLSEIE